MRTLALAGICLLMYCTSAYTQTPSCKDFAGRWNNSKDVTIDLTIDPNCTFSYKAQYGIIGQSGTGEAYFDAKEGIVFPFQLVGGGETDRFMLRYEQNLLTGTVRAYSIPRPMTFDRAT